MRCKQESEEIRTKSKSRGIKVNAVSDDDWEIKSWTSEHYRTRVDKESLGAKRIDH